MLRTLREQADGRTNARLLHPDAKYSRASRIFYGRFLRPEDFLLQNCATQRNAARMLNCRITQHPQRCATLRKRAQKLCLELEIRCRLYIYSRQRRRAKKIRVRKAISKAISGAENGICYASALWLSSRNSHSEGNEVFRRESVRHELRHSMRMRAFNVAVGVEN